MKMLAAATFFLCVLTLIQAAAFPECGKTVCKTAASTDPTAQAVVIDPVCGMDVAVKDAKYSYEYEGKTYYFCSKNCRDSFVKAPAKFIGKEKK